jgi:hypothetical protein
MTKYIWLTLIGIVVSCSVEDQRKTTTNSERQVDYSYLHDYLKDCDSGLFDDTLSYMHREDFWECLDSLPHQFAKTIIEDFGIEENMYYHFGLHSDRFDSLKFVYGKKTNARFDPFHTNSDSTYYFMIAIYEDSISRACCFYLDFERRNLGEWYYPFLHPDGDSAKYVGKSIKPLFTFEKGYMDLRIKLESAP